MKDASFEIGELVKYPVYDDNGGEISLEIGLIIDVTTDDGDDLPKYMRHEPNDTASRVYKIVGNQIYEEGWYYSWEILKLDLEDEIVINQNGTQDTEV